MTVVVAATALGRIGAVSLARFSLDQSRGGCGGRVEARTFCDASVSTHATIILLSLAVARARSAGAPCAAKLTRTTVKMRISFAAALILCTAAAFAPQQHTTRNAVKLYSSVKPSAGISFYDGLYEPDVPDVKLTRCRCSVLQNVTTPSTRNVVTNTLIHAVAAQVQGRRERRRDLQF